MAKFKVGDRVKCKNDGDKGTITRKTDAPHCWWVMWDDDGAELFIDEDGMKLIKNKKPKAKYMGALTAAQLSIVLKLAPYISEDDSDLSTHELANAICDRIVDDEIVG